MVIYDNGKFPIKAFSYFLFLKRYLFSANLKAVRGSIIGYDHRHGSRKRSRMLQCSATEVTIAQQEYDSQDDDLVVLYHTHGPRLSSSFS
jgi:hypothetical protein